MIKGGELEKAIYDTIHSLEKKKSSEEVGYTIQMLKNVIKTNRFEP